MTMVQATSEHSPTGNVHCPRCNAILPPHASFCGSCGERVGKEKKSSSPVQEASDTPSRYQIISLVRQRPYVKVFLGVDTQLQRAIVMRNIDVSSLNEEAQAKASELVQNEYDLLRQQDIAYIMPVIDVQNSQGHLLTITSQPVKVGRPVAQTAFQEGSHSSSDDGAEGHKEAGRGLCTLKDFLESGKYVPSQQIAITWIKRLCRSLEGLHRHNIVVGDLDPYAIVLDDHDQDSQPLLAVSWLPPQLRELFPHILSIQGKLSSSGALATSFTAPEVLLGKVEAISDVYSLGAILYLLLTGTPPDELIRRTQQRLRSPDELNSGISRGVAEIAIQALSLEPSKRFQSVKELAEALTNGHTFQGVKVYPRQSAQNGNYMLERDQLADMDTINMTPFHSYKSEPSPLWEVPTSEIGLASVQNTVGETGSDSTKESQLTPLKELNTSQDESERTSPSLVQQFTQQISGMLPAIPNLPKQITGILSPIQRTSQEPAEQPQGRTWPLPIPQVGFLSPKPDGTPLESIERPSASYATGVTLDGTNAADESLLKQIQRMLIGERKQTTTAATIENPLRLQPDQGFNIRIRLMGRDEPDADNLLRGQASDPMRPHSRLYGTMEGLQPAGLSARVHGELVYVEVRSAIHEHYAYIVQQASVKIPALGYVAEIVIPMQPFSRKSNGRRERLHVFFFDEMRRPLYERPFVLEILISYLVQPGREGHHVLPIPQ